MGVCVAFSFLAGYLQTFLWLGGSGSFKKKGEKILDL